MSLYDNNDPWGLYENVGMPDQSSVPAANVETGDDAGNIAKPSDAGLVAAADLVAAGPAELLTEAVTPGPGMKLPLGIAILGACVVGALFANSIDKRRDQ